MEKPPLIFNIFGIVGIKTFFLYSILSIECWVLDTLNPDNGTVVGSLHHSLVKLCECKLVPITSSCKVNHTQWNFFLSGWIYHWLPVIRKYF